MAPTPSRAEYLFSQVDPEVWRKLVHAWHEGRDIDRAIATGTHWTCNVAIDSYEPTHKHPGENERNAY